jgi:hypothetical protein
MSRQDILFPVGRLVEGSLTQAQTTDAENKPLVVKSGPNIGQPRVDYYFAVAIPKGAEQSWAQTDWGGKIYAIGQAAFPNMMQNPAFAWKVKDGDSQIPNRRGKKPCDKEGHPGHWIVSFSSGFAPKAFDAKGQSVVDPASIKLGHYVQVFGNCDGNGSPNQPGVFINHSMVAHAGFGPEIYVGPDPTGVGFGTGATPAGMSATPVAGIASPANVPNAGALPSPAGNAPLPGMPNPGGTTPVVPAPATAVVPAPEILAGPQRQMTPKAGAITYEQFIATGNWTDELLIRDGYMTIS